MQFCIFPTFTLCVSLHRKLAGCTLFITGASRGIGKAIALRAARDGANVVIAAKTAEAHPKLPGTVFTAAKEGEQTLQNSRECFILTCHRKGRNTIDMDVAPYTLKCRL